MDVSEYHVYGMEWTETQIQFFVDGVVYGTFTLANADYNGKNPFKKPHYIIFNLAINGYNPPDETTPKKAVMYVDWVRVYAPVAETVYVNPTSVLMDSPTVTLGKGAKRIANGATILPANASEKTLLWSSADESIVTVASGYLTAKALGIATITVKTLNGKTDTCVVTVTDVLATDTFNRANSITSLGLADTGQAWSMDALNPSSKIGINTNKAYPVSIGTGAQNLALAHLNAAAADAKVSADIVFALNEGVIGRYKTDNTYLVARLSATGLALFETTPAGGTQIGEYLFTPVIGTTYNVLLQMSGTSITVLLDGVQRIAATSALNQAETLAGIRFFGGLNGRIDNFNVRSI